MKITYGGTEYDSVDDLPPEARAGFEAAMAALHAGGGAGAATDGGAPQPNVHVRIDVKRKVRRPPASAGEKRALVTIVAALLPAALLFLAEWRGLAYTFDHGALFLWGGGAGLILGALVIAREAPRWGLRPAPRWMVAALVAVSFVALGWAGASFSNRRFASAPPQAWQFTVTRKLHIVSHTAKSTDTWEVFVSSPRGPQRFPVSPATFERLQVGQAYTGTVRMGFWGYPFLLPPGLQ